MNKTYKGMDSVNRLLRFLEELNLSVVLALLKTPKLYTDSSCVVLVESNTGDSQAEMSGL